jgi:hypothetical protein
MNIIEALLEETGIRVSNSNDRWLVIDELYRLGGEFVVYEKQPYAKKTIEVYRGIDEEEAVRVLLNREEE